MRRRLRHNMKHTNKQPVAQYMPRHGTNKFCVHDQMCTCVHVRGCVCLFVCVVLVCLYAYVPLASEHCVFAKFVCLQHLFVCNICLTECAAERRCMFAVCLFANTFVCSHVYRLLHGVGENKHEPRHGNHHVAGVTKVRTCVRVRGCVCLHIG